MEESVNKKKMKSNDKNKFLSIPNELFVELTNFFSSPRTVFAFHLTCREIFSLFQLKGVYLGHENVVFRPSFEIVRNLLETSQELLENNFVTSLLFNWEDWMDETETFIFFLPKFPRLRSLNIQNCNLEDEALQLNIFSKITELDISCNKKLTNNAFLLLGKVRKLTMRECSQYTISDDAFKYLTSIKELDISGCNQGTITNRALMHVKGVQKLILRFCYQEGINNEGFKYLQDIKELNMRSCVQTTLSTAMMKHIRNVESLCLRECKYSLVMIEGFKFLKCIKKLSLNNCAVSKQDRVQFKWIIMTVMDTIEELSLENCGYVRDEDFKYLKDKKNFKKLNISHCGMITDDVFKNLGSDIEVLRIAGNFIRGRDFSKYGLGANLRSLDLSHCCNIKFNVFYGLKKLEVVDISLTKKNLKNLIVEEMFRNGKEVLDNDFNCYSDCVDDMSDSYSDLEEDEELTMPNLKHVFVVGNNYSQSFQEMLEKFNIQVHSSYDSFYQRYFKDDWDV